MPQAHAKFEYALWKSHWPVAHVHFTDMQKAHEPISSSSTLLSWDMWWRRFGPNNLNCSSVRWWFWCVKNKGFFGNPQKNLCFSPTLLNRFRCKQLCTYLKVHSSSRFAYLTTWKSTRVCDSGHNLTFRQNVAKTLGVVQSSSQI